MKLLLLLFLQIAYHHSTGFPGPRKFTTASRLSLNDQLTDTITLVYSEDLPWRPLCDNTQPTTSTNALPTRNQRNGENRRNINRPPTEQNRNENGVIILSRTFTNRNPPPTYADVMKTTRNTGSSGVKRYHNGTTTQQSADQPSTSGMNRASTFCVPRRAFTRAHQPNRNYGNRGVGRGTKMCNSTQNKENIGPRGRIPMPPRRIESNRQPLASIREEPVDSIQESTNNIQDVPIATVCTHNLASIPPSISEFHPTQRPQFQPPPIPSSISTASQLEILRPEFQSPMRQSRNSSTTSALTSTTSVLRTRMATTTPVTTTTTTTTAAESSPRSPDLFEPSNENTVNEPYQNAQPLSNGVSTQTTPVGVVEGRCVG